MSSLDRGERVVNALDASRAAGGRIAARAASADGREAAIEQPLGDGRVRALSLHRDSAVERGAIPDTMAGDLELTAFDEQEEAARELALVARERDAVLVPRGRGSSAGRRQLTRLR